MREEKEEKQMVAATVDKTPDVVIRRPNIQTIELKIRGASPFVQLRFSQKARDAMRAKMELGDQAKKNRKREPRKFEDEFESAMYRSEQGWRGVPASSFRNAAISACRIAGFQMTKAKLSIFVPHDGVDAIDGTPLVRINGEPKAFESTVRNETGVADIRVRAMWREWSATIRVQYDADQFSATDIVNLFMRVGLQVGIGEGRPDSKSSAGMGWGLFELVSE
jgi:hypothetical protein